ncbi:hypothetical protein Rhow_006897 [Rhodococcus wratislaviensis]|uniref:Uncharacterized protein n=1 Tax=Rhodococcus wratislaviensis TaxID=44752 RepID=A0A402CGM6_RHOWR|nr:hypothetical protein Rhow_006897 [Rhodococcus wratislaviensis]
MGLPPVPYRRAILSAAVSTDPLMRLWRISMMDRWTGSEYSSASAS